MNWIIAGLGNPGAEYDGTRHNVGFLVLDILARRWGVKLKKLKFRSFYAENAGCVLLKPQTFMNLSGQAVRQAMDFYKLPPERVLVVYDDVSLPPGKLRLRQSGSDGGHNGIKSILTHLQTDTFPRLKLGVGAKPHAEMDLADWVLGRFAADEITLMRTAAERAADVAEAVLRDGVSDTTISVQ